MNRAGVVALAAAIPMVALTLDPSGWFPFGPSKWIVVSTLLPTGAALVLWRSRIIIDRRVVIAVVAFLTWLSIAAIAGYERWYAWVGTPERHLGVVTWVVCCVALVAGHAFDRTARRGALSWALAVAALGAGGAATAEALGFEPSVFAVTAGRLTATMGSAAFLGALTTLLLPAVVGIAADRTQTAWLRRTAGVALLPIAIACLGSGARAAWVGLAGAVAVLLIVRRAEVRASGRRAVAGALAAALVLAVVAWWSPVGGRVASASDPDSAGGRSRVDEWRVAANVIAKHPVTGAGPEGYRIAFAEGVDDHYEQAYGRDPLPDRAHSGPLDVALAGGIPLLLIWAVLVLLMSAAAITAMRADDASTAGIGVAVVAYFVGQLLLFPTAELEPVAWLLGGVLLGARASRSARATVAVSRAVTRPISGVLAVVAVVALLAGARDVVADRRAQNAVEALRTGATRVAASDANAAVDLRPDEVRLHLLLAQAQEADQQGTVAALASVDDALRISPLDPASQRLRAELLIDRATATHLPGDVANARTATQQLVARDPHNAALWLLDAEAARTAGDLEGAAASRAQADRLAGSRSRSGS